MNGFARGLGSTLGLKFLMGLTGLVLFLFTVGHMLGNLSVFSGPEKLNAYAHFLKSSGPLLWGARAGLLLTVTVHVVCAVALTRRNREARPSPYAESRPIQSTYASRTMLMSGLVVLAFVIYHLLHFTLGVTDPSNFTKVDAFGRPDVHHMVVQGFRQPLVASIYIAAMLLLGLHLSHGVQSVFQSLGLMHRRSKTLIRRACLGLVWLVIALNIAMPLFILLRIYSGGGSVS